MKSPIVTALRTSAKNAPLWAEIMEAAADEIEQLKKQSEGFESALFETSDMTKSYEFDTKNIQRETIASLINEELSVIRLSCGNKRSVIFVSDAKNFMDNL